MSSKKVTSIDFLNNYENTENTENKENKENKENNKELDDISLRHLINDLFLPIKDRLRFLSIYNSRNDDITEFISSIIGMYSFSKTKALKEYLISICEFYEINIINRIECAKSLISEEKIEKNDENEKNGYFFINQMFLNEHQKIMNLSTPLKVNTVLFLMNCNSYKKESLKYFIDIICDHSIQELYRLKIIQSLETKFKITNETLPLRISKRMPQPDPKNKENFIYFAKESCLSFINDNLNTFTYRVIACQYLLEKCDVDDNLKLFVENFLISIAEDITLNDDLRADSCDVLLQYGRDEIIEHARNIIFVLGGGHRGQNNIFQNAQNVHVRSIEQSVQTIINTLVSYHPKNKKFYNFKETHEEILKLIENEEKNTHDQIEGSLNRISLDRAVYGNNKVTLSSILSYVWTYINDSEFKEELQKRLLEELVESSNKCSTGYASRIVNSLSGFTDMNITISYEDQICSNLEGRLNAKIRLIKDEDYMEKILNEMIIPVIHYNLRLNFLKFFRENISNIRQEMYEEFRQYMEDVDYDFYFRKAIIRWEGCN